MGHDIDTPVVGRARASARLEKKESEQNLEFTKFSRRILATTSYKDVIESSCCNAANMQVVMEWQRDHFTQARVFERRRYKA